jgi:hypothetical protein
MPPTRRGPLLRSTRPPNPNDYVGRRLLSTRVRIRICVRTAIVTAIILASVLASQGRILGVFQGQIVRGPYVHDKGKWLVVQSRNGYVRKVEISRANIEYEEDFPASARRTKAEESLVEAIEVRITAERANSGKGDGDWKATEILILNPKTPGTERTSVAYKPVVRLEAIVR